MQSEHDRYLEHHSLPSGYKVSVVSAEATSRKHKAAGSTRSQWVVIIAAFSAE